MKGLICYFSGTGNTLLACKYIRDTITGVDFDLYDITSGNEVNYGNYDIVGFACYADFLGPSPLIRTFIKRLPVQSRKPSFVFNTYGNFNGATLATLTKSVRSRGFDIIAGYALHMPENIPNMIMMGLANTQAPDEKELAGFKAFIDGLSGKIEKLKNGVNAPPLIPEFSERLLFAIPRFIPRLIMGKKMVDTERCIKCGICVKKCPYHAITINEYPVFEEKRCQSCWRCYNLCREKAIYTKKYRDVAHSPEPIVDVKKKLELPHSPSLTP
ncbi:MAG: EFR1 family ferrodoxin [Fibrobacterota bacterium]|nr:EFR1 family ferrodoxin [Chitinispirillaceae bacterium]